MSSDFIHTVSALRLQSRGTFKTCKKFIESVKSKNVPARAAVLCLARFYFVGNFWTFCSREVLPSGRSAKKDIISRFRDLF